jgi:hypothetical protein
MAKLRESYNIGTISTEKWGRYNGLTSLTELLNQKQHWETIGSAFRDLDHQTSVINQVAGFINDLALPELYATSEKDNADKFVLQNLKPTPYWFIDSFGGERDVERKVIDAAARLLTLFLKTRESESDDQASEHYKILEISDPLTTNKGAPIHSSDVGELLKVIDDLEGLYKSTDANLVNLIDSYALQESVAARLASVFPKYGEDPKTYCCSKVGRRSGPNRKARLIYEHRGTTIRAEREISPYMRDRHIYMVPYVLNVALAPVYADFVRHVSGVREVANNETVRAKFASWISGSDSSMGMFEADISGMDRAFPEYLTNKMFDVLNELRRDRTSEGYTLPVVLASRQLHRMGILLEDFLNSDNTGTGVLCVPRETVGRYSGIKMTTAFNTMGHLAVHLAALSQVGLISDSDFSFLDSSVFIRIQGDDVIIVPSDRCSPDDLAAYVNQIPITMSQFGFESEVFPGNTYLMRHYDQEGADHPVISRVIQQTVSPERPKTDPRIIAIGQASRTMGWRELPSELAKTKTDAEAVIGELSLERLHITVMSDNEKRSLISALSLELASSERGLSVLTEYLLENRFSTSGREIANALPTAVMKSIIDDSITEARGVYLYARDMLGPLEED